MLFSMDEFFDCYYLFNWLFSKFISMNPGSLLQFSFNHLPKINLFTEGVKLVDTEFAKPHRLKKIHNIYIYYLYIYYLLFIYLFIY